MYTQCPDCNTAFRVTAEVLKQAAGKVRCGTCRHAFNALEYLSETKPDPVPLRDAEESLPELKPDPAENDAGLPASISAEQSAALLKTLDELAGSDIRIEDTGVEWRVFDADEQGDAVVDELLEESPTPVDQFLTETPTAVDAPEVFADEANSSESAGVEELRFDDNTPLPDHFEFGDTPMPVSDTSAAAEEEYPDEAATAEPATAPQTDLDLSEPGEWTDILDEFEDLAEAVAAPLKVDSNVPDEAIGELQDDEPAGETDVATIVAADDSEPGSDDDEPLDINAQFALQAEALGIDLSGIHETPELDDAADADADLDDLDDLDALLEENDPDDLDIDELLDEESVEETVVDDLFGEESADEADDDVPSADDDDDGEYEDEYAIGEAAQLELIDAADADAEPDDDVADQDDADSAADDDSYIDEIERIDEHHVPPMSEEEQTINMMIDQDLMSLAVPDDDGFASTIVIPEQEVESSADEEDEAQPANNKDPLQETGAGFETIIMEGEHIRSELDQEKLAADAAAAASLAGAAAAERDAERPALDGRKRLGYIGGIVLLALLLGGQVLHQSRDALATNATFNDLVGPVYRAIGQPLSPDWDITGWRFEATKGSTDDTDQELTIYSRIGNTSSQPLPYPLIGISLTDRFEETIGSRMLDPGEYLSNDLDPRKLVQPGNTFNAVISIQSPAQEATGFKLNVCYRESGGQLRCALNDFK